MYNSENSGFLLYLLHYDRFYPQNMLKCGESCARVAVGRGPGDTDANISVHDIVEIRVCVEALVGRTRARTAAISACSIVIILIEDAKPFVLSFAVTRAISKTVVCV